MKYRKILFVLALIVMIGLVRFLTNLIIYSGSHCSVARNGENAIETIHIDEGFVLWRSLQRNGEKSKGNLSNKVLVRHFFDMFSSKNYLIWNYLNENIKFYTPWFFVNLQKGLTKITVYNSGKVRVVNSDRTTVFKDIPINKFYHEDISDLRSLRIGKIGGDEIPQLMRMKRNDEIEVRSKLFSLYFYVSIIILLILNYKGFRVHLTSIFYFAMVILFGEMFIRGGILFNFPFIASSPQPLFVKAIMFFLVLYSLKLFYKGIKEVKSLRFYDIGIIIFFFLLPWILYY